MRTLTTYLVTLVSVLGFATASQAAIQIDFEFAGNVQSVNALPSDLVQVWIYLTATGSTAVTGYQFAITYDNSEITASSGSALTNAVTHAANGTWVNGGPGLLLDTGTAYGAAISSSTLVAGDAITAADGKVHIGTITFHVSGAVSDGSIDIGGCFDCTIFGPTGDGRTGTGDLTTTFNGAAVNIPEPTTASLLGLGLLGLTVAGRRRKS